MAERRMFSKSVVESARFLKMPPSSQNLYFHLGMNADDDGIVEAYPVINMIKALEDDLRVLFSKGFVKILNPDLVTYIADWREQNRIRPDRKKDSVYRDLLLQIEPDAQLLERKERSDLRKKPGPSMDGGLTAQWSVGQYSIGEGSKGECNTPDTYTHNVKYQLGSEILTQEEYDNLIRVYPEELVKSVIKRILGKPYHGCLNADRISAWCKEQMGSTWTNLNNHIETSVHSDRLKELAEEWPGD